MPSDGARVGVLLPNHLALPVLLEVLPGGKEGGEGEGKGEGDKEQRNAACAGTKIGSNWRRVHTLCFTARGQSLQTTNLAASPFPRNADVSVEGTSERKTTVSLIVTTRVRQLVNLLSSKFSCSLGHRR